MVEHHGVRGLVAVHRQLGGHTGRVFHREKFGSKRPHESARESLRGSTAAAHDSGKKQRN